MSYSEDDFVPLSAVAHYAHCPRRCALIHVDRLWQDNRFTAEGNALHEKAHSGQVESRDDVIVARSLAIRSSALGLMGVTDVVEFYRNKSGVRIPSHSGAWIPRPVEYKRGAAKDDYPYRIQLCAQTICLEEAFGLHIETASLYIGVDRHRIDVRIDDRLRSDTRMLCEHLHDVICSGVMPRAEFSQKCESCSLVDVCCPAQFAVRTWIDRRICEELEILR